MPSAAKRQKAQEELELQMQKDFDDFVRQYPVDHPFPAKVESSTEKPLRTNEDLVQHRLIESGVMFEDAQQVESLVEACAGFVSNLDKTECFQGVQVSLEDSEGKQKLKVKLSERNWYKLYVGGGLKQDGLLQSGGDYLFPKVQFETSASLLNLTGHLDTTSVQYALDQTSSATVRFSHERPIYTLFTEGGDLYNTILALDKGSQIYYGLNAVLDTVDHEWTRSYKEYQRLLSARISSVGSVPVPEMAEGGYIGLDWSILFRDVIPRRHPTQPFALDASPEIVSQSGPSVKHSLKYEFRTNGAECDDRFSPSSGLDFQTKLEVAGPPGDVGFVKWEGGLAAHMPMQETEISLHGSINMGFMQALSFAGLCLPPTVSDRFFLGGPMQLRGFMPSGIGPRAKTGGASTPGGDALGGDCFYVATLAASIPFPLVSLFKDNGVRLFAFSNIGTVASLSVPWQSILRSTRASAGCGMSMSTSFGRMELTYAIPTRHGPRDARRSVQLGLGFSFG